MNIFLSFLLNNFLNFKKNNFFKMDQLHYLPNPRGGRYLADR